MSVNMAQGDIVMGRINTSDGLSQLFNVCHYQLALINSVTPGEPPPTTVFADEFLPVFATNLAEKIKPAWAACSSAQMTIDGVTAQCIWPLPRSRPYTYLTSEEKVGDIAGDMLPTQDALTILKRTIFGERWGIGRYFHSGIPESMQDKGLVTGPYMTLVEALADELEEGFTTTVGQVIVTWIPVLFSLTPPPVVAARVTNISDMIVSDPLIKTQRRRRPGKGI